jgi:hypothetical protein
MPSFRWLSPIILSGLPHNSLGPSEKRNEKFWELEREREREREVAK